MTNEAFARIKIDQLLKDTDWRLTDGISVRYEYPLDDGGRADYVLFDRQGRALAALESKSTRAYLAAGEADGPALCGPAWLASLGHRRRRHTLCLPAISSTFHHQLARHRNRRLGVALALGELQPPRLDRGLSAVALQHDGRCLVERAPHVRVARLADEALHVDGRAQLSAPRRQAETGGDVARSAEAAWVVDRGPHRQRGNRANAGHANEAPATCQSRGQNVHCARAVAFVSKDPWSHRCWPIPARSLCTAIWIAAVAALLTKTANAETLVHLSRPVWGCVDPNEAAHINDNSNPAKSDPQWVARTAADGQCVMLGSVGQWATLSENYNGLTYVGHRGGIGRTGSFWVPTTALVIDAKQSTPAVAAPQPTVQTATVKPSIIAVKPSTETTPAPQQAPPLSSPVAAAPEPTPTSSAAPSSSPQQSGGSITIWVILGVLFVLGLFGRSKRQKKSAQRKPAKTKGEPPIKPTTGLDFRIHPSSLADAQKLKGKDGTEAVISPKMTRQQATPDEFNKKPSTKSATIDFRIHPTSLADAQKPEAPDSIQTVIAPSDFQVRVESTISQPGKVTLASPNSRSTWHPPGTSVSIAGTTVMDGMLYVGKTGGSYGNYDGCVIDPKLPLGAAAAAEPLGYWPSYQNISPNCRKRYLEWLGRGKRAADIDIGYVFLYFYGLERRLILEAPPATEVESLSQELQRLGSLYSSNGSFNGYSARLLEAVTFLRDAKSHNSAIFVPDLVVAAGEMPPALKLAIAREVVSGQPLKFELAAAALIGMRDVWTSHRRVLDRARQPLLQVLRTRFADAFPSGFLVRNRKNSQLAVTYRGATGGLYVDLVVQAGLKGLPDPETLTWTKLLSLAEGVANELAPLAKLLAYYPTRAKSLAALVSCPAELRDSIAVDARRWFDALALPAPVPFGLLAKHAIGAESTKWTVRHRRQISEALAAIGCSMEPGPDDAIERLSDETVVYVIRGVNDGQSREMAVASAAAMLVANIAKANKAHSTKLEEFWLSRLPSRLALPVSQTERLRARLAWYRTSNVAIPKVKRLLGDATLEERELCAWSATVATGVTGNVDKPQIAALEAIYDALGVARNTLYTGLHAGVAATTNGADEPVEVSNEVAEFVHPIPPPPAAKPVGPDVDRLAKIRAETESVSAMLATIFTEAEAEPEEATPASDSPLTGLDSEHAALLNKLVMRPEWVRQEFEAIAVSLNLMPDGALEAINEWAFDRYGDALVEDGDPLALNLDLLAQDLLAITASELK